MQHYAIVRFETKEEAEKFAFDQKNVQVEVVDHDHYAYRHMYENVELVINEYMKLSEEDKEKVDVAAVVDKLFSFDYSNYNDHIESLINEQLKEHQEQPLAEQE